MFPPPDPPCARPPSARPPLPQTPCLGPPSAGPPLRQTAQNFALVFTSPAPNFALFLSLGVFSLNFGGVFEGRDTQTCTFGLSGYPSSPHPSGRGPPGSHFFCPYVPHFIIFSFILFCAFFYCFCQDQLSFPAMQVTSSHVPIWFHFPASYDEYTALVKFGNVASEHVKRAISVVQPQLSAAQQNHVAEQQNRVGPHHPAWMSHHTGGSRQGHPRYTGAQKWEGRGWPDQEISQSAAAHRHVMQKLFNRVMSPKHAKTTNTIDEHKRSTRERRV